MARWSGHGPIDRWRIWRFLTLMGWLVIVSSVWGWCRGKSGQVKRITTNQWTSSWRSQHAKPSPRHGKDNSANPSNCSHKPYKTIPAYPLPSYNRSKNQSKQSPCASNRSKPSPRATNKSSSITTNKPFNTTTNPSLWTKTSTRSPTRPCVLISWGTTVRR